MKAFVYHNYGDSSVLQLKAIPKPIPKDNELLVKIHASTVSSSAVLLRRGLFPGSKLFTVLLRLRYGITRPTIAILGFEYSGVVESVGKDIRLYKKGDEVYGTTTGLKAGAYADYVCVTETSTERVVSLKPKQLNFEEAAALPIGGMAALHLLDKAKITNGKAVLIYGASGSVGSYAIQIAKYFGAMVTGVCSGANVSLVASLGADHVINYQTENILDVDSQYDIVFDAVGKLNEREGKKLLKTGGKFCTIKSITSEKQQFLSLLHLMIQEGKLKPAIDRIYPFLQLRQAHEYAETGRKKGNVVIKHF